MSDTHDIDESMGAVMPILMDCDKDEDFSEGMDKVGETLPILPLRNMVLFPGVAMPIFVGRPKSMRLIREASQRKLLVGVVCQKDAEVEEPGLDDLYPIGTVAEVLRVLEMPDGSTTAILQGRKRMALHSLVDTEPYLNGAISLLDDQPAGKDDREYEALISTIKDLTIKMIEAAGDPPRELVVSIRNMQNTMYMLGFACCHIVAKPDEKQELLAIDDVKNRAYRLLFILNREYQLIELKTSIQMKTHEDINKQQKEYFLQQQMKAIQEELGGSMNDIEIRELRAQAKKKKWPKEVGETFEKELAKLERIHPQSPDYSIQSQYVQTIVGLPWGTYSRDHFSLPHAQRVLDRDHYGMEKVKERIIEHLAVLKLKRDLRSPILCLYGPPGVGKTSLGRSVAEALGRKYVRVSLGGLHDEAEIRGHRRTYIGAMMGRILQNLQKAGTSNPVFVLDEVDKVGSDFKGDPASALLEVLDPEQNTTFHDNYLDIDYDLSKVLFIATANNISTIPQALRDRMELIEVSGYIAEEKLRIAEQHLLPKEAKEHGLSEYPLRFAPGALETIIEEYTRESGVRALTKKIAAVLRKIAWAVASGDPLPEEITPELIHEYLGKTIYSRDRYQGNEYPGVVIGLAWTSVGGEILFIESSLQPGQNGKLILTGSLGDVMKESATIALSYIRAHAEQLGIDLEQLKDREIHIHVPEGAIPKDGPSAGITMVTSLVSAITRRKVRPHLAMTGEITLRGKVLPVGGIKEKILAAKRSGITDIILCRENEKDILEINERYLDGLTFHYVDEISEVLSFALLDERAGEPNK